MNILHKTALGVLFCGLAVNSLAAAQLTASDGRLGPTSTGTVPVTLIMPAVVRISGLGDFSFTYDPNTPRAVTGSQNFCVYTNNASAQYDLSITSGNPSAGSDFQLSENSKTIVYNVYFSPVKNATDNFTKLTSGGKQAGTDANTTLINCGGESGDVATLKVEIPEANLWAVPLGTYNDVLTLTVTAK